MYYLAQTNNPFQDLEDSLYQTIVQVQGAWFTSPWYANWLFLMGTFTGLFFLYAVIGKSFYLYLTNKPGVIREVLVEYVRGLIIVICTLNVHVFVDFIFTLFLFFIDFGNQLLTGTANTAIDIVQLINDTALQMSQASFDPLSIIYGLSWFTLMCGVVVMGVVYVINLGEAVFYLFVIFPFLCRAGVMGLLLPQTSHWFATITNLALEQLLKPLLGKVFFWSTFILLQVGFQRITDATIGLQTQLSQIAWLLFAICFGVIMQFRVASLARFLSLVSRTSLTNVASAGGTFLKAAVSGAGLINRTLTRPLANVGSAALGAVARPPLAFAVNTVGQTQLARNLARATFNIPTRFNQAVSSPLSYRLSQGADFLTRRSGVNFLTRGLGDVFQPVYYGVQAAPKASASSPTPASPEVKP